MDPGLAGGLREWLEDELAPLAGRHQAPGPLVIGHRWAAGQGVGLRAVDASGQEGGDHAEGGRAAVSELRGCRTLGLPEAQRLLAVTLFRQLATIGRIAHPLEDALAGLAVSTRGDEVAGFLAGRSAGERSRLRHELSTLAARMTRDWPALAPTWLPRTDEQLAVPLAGGRVVLSGAVDLVVGTPSEGRASVCLVALGLGDRQGEDRSELRFLALLETLRSGAPPARVARYRPLLGEVDAEDVTEALLTDVVQQLVGASRRAVPVTATGPRVRARDGNPMSRRSAA